jgi:hypothetical protein
MAWKEFRRVISQNIENCPTNGEKQVCAMYNIVGRCPFGSQCKHSHDELPSDVRDEFEEWIKECKSKAKQNNKKGGKKNKKSKE